MRSRRRRAALVAALILGAASGLNAAEAPSFGAPILKWQRGGCFGSYCQTGWYSSPAVADLNGDGTLEVIVGGNSDQVTVYDRFGGVVWTRNPFGSGEVRTLAVADLETDGQLELVVDSPMTARPR
jgi:hypothetical protein